VVRAADEVEVWVVEVGGGELVVEDVDPVVGELRLGAVTEPDDPGSPEQAPRNRAAAVTITAPARGRWCGRRPRGIPH
jgi:hypothetical protein